MADNLTQFIFSMKEELMLFDLLTEQEVEQIIPYLEVAVYPKDTTLFNEGDSGDFLMFILNGSMEVKKSTEFKGKQIVLAKLGRCSLVGELSFVDVTQPRSATVVASEDSEVVILRREKLDALTIEYPVIGVKILKGLIRVLAIRLRKAVERLSMIF